MDIHAAHRQAEGALYFRDKGIKPPS